MTKETKNLNTKELTIAEVKKAIEAEREHAEVLSLLLVSLMTEALVKDKDEVYNSYDKQFENIQGRREAFKEALELINKVPELPHKDTTEYDRKLLKDFLMYFLTVDMKGINTFTPDGFVEEFLSSHKGGEPKC